MKMKRFFSTVGVLFFLVSVVFLAPCRGDAFNPQPEPPGKQQNKVKPGETKSGIAIEDKKKTPTKQKGKSSPGSAKSGIAIEEKKNIAK